MKTPKVSNKEIQEYKDRCELLTSYCIYILDECTEDDKITIKNFLKTYKK